MIEIIEQEFDNMIIDAIRSAMLEEIMVMRWGWIVL